MKNKKIKTKSQVKKISLPKQIVSRTTLNGTGKGSRRGDFLKIKTRIGITQRYKTSYRKIDNFTSEQIKRITPILQKEEIIKVKTKYDRRGGLKATYEQQGKDLIKRITTRTRKRLKEIIKPTKRKQILTKPTTRTKLLKNKIKELASKTLDQLKLNIPETYKELLDGMLNKPSAKQIKIIIDNPQTIRNNLFYEIELWGTEKNKQGLKLIAVGTDNNKTIEELINNLKQINEQQIGKNEKYYTYIPSNGEGLEELEQKAKINGQFQLINQNGGAIKEIRIKVKISEGN